MPSFLTLVPSAPRNLTQTVDSSTESSIYLQWERPLSPNGVINRYQIAYRGLQTPNAVYIGNFTSTSLQLVDPPVTFFNLSGGLIPGSSYEIAVQAATSAGLGPSSNKIVAVTAESGNLMNFVWFTVNTCQCILNMGCGCRSHARPYSIREGITVLLLLFPVIHNFKQYSVSRYTYIRRAST